MTKAFIAVIIATIALIIVFQAIDPNNNSVINNPNNTTSVVEGDNLSVSINGEITRPGTYYVDLNSTLEDLISVAGGVTSHADELAYDTSYVLKDGYTFYIAAKYDNTDVCTLEPIIKVNINTDDEETLQTVAGIGSTIAKAIISYREQNGEFYRIEDVKNVSGIGNATFEKIKNYIKLRTEWYFYSFQLP